LVNKGNVEDNGWRGARQTHVIRGWTSCSMTLSYTQCGSMGFHVSINTRMADCVRGSQFLHSNKHKEGQFGNCCQAKRPWARLRRWAQ
jgi:hypothetical protein